MFFGFSVRMKWIKSFSEVLMRVAVLGTQWSKIDVSVGECRAYGRNIVVVLLIPLLIAQHYSPQPISPSENVLHDCFIFRNISSFRRLSVGESTPAGGFSWINSTDIVCNSFISIIYRHSILCWSSSSSILASRGLFFSGTWCQCKFSLDSYIKDTTTLVVRKLYTRAGRYYRNFSFKALKTVPSTNSAHHFTVCDSATVRCWNGTSLS